MIPMENPNRKVQLTKNFSLEEFECKDGTAVPLHLHQNVNSLAFNLQILREHINKPIIILSGYRTEAYNKKVGGARMSQHLKAKAADIVVHSLSIYTLSRIIEDLIADNFMMQGGLGLYDTFLHYDIRGQKARWDFRTSPGQLGLLNS